MKEFRLLDTGKLSAAANMALDEIVLGEVAGGASPPTLRFLQFDPPAALVGYHQDVSHEIRVDFCREHGIEINRRHTGGGAILFQPSALGWEMFGVPGEPPFAGTYEAILFNICSIAAEGLSRLGIPAQFRPRNDIEVEGRKISGTGGTVISGGFMFQGTVLVQNEIELFLKALRVPVEKLKKREIESLMERICFLSDLMRPTPKVDLVKLALASAFTDALGIRLVPSGLTDQEQQLLKARISYFQSEEWIFSHSRPADESEPLREIMQTAAGTLRVHLWLAPGGRRVRQALVTGDFFALPQRFVHDLEAALVGVTIDGDSLRSTVLSFFDSYDGCLLGIKPHEVAAAISTAGERRRLVDAELSAQDVNDLFLLNVSPKELYGERPRWLLLPYCSKSLACPYREIPGCDECGACEIAECFALAKSFNMNPITVQSFEHLMEVLRKECEGKEGLYVGSCCEAFYSKHRREMEEINARGVIVNLDSTTCYDLGKGTAAYKGRFDNKTYLNLSLIEKTMRRLHATAR
ncbi:MAG: DUF116 domain-containing protein [Thermodesulfobacteriota bacterium]